MPSPIADRTPVTSPVESPVEHTGRRRSAPKASRLPHWCLLGTCLISACSGTEVLGSTPPTSCDFADYELGGNARQEIKVATFWTDPAERRAFDELGGSLPSTAFYVSPRDSRDDQQKTLRDLLHNDSDPLPDAFQVNGGSDVLQWVHDGPFEETRLCPLDHLDRRYGFRDHFFDAAIAPVSCHGSLYGLPVGVHRLNVLFYNEDLVDRLVEESAGSATPLERPEELDGIDAFIEHLERIQALQADIEDLSAVVPLALGNSITWPLTILAFENLMVAQGTGLYEAVWMGPPEMHGSTEAALRGSLAELVDHLRALAAVSNLDRRMEWQEAMQLVAQGQAVYTVMGDWGWAQVTDASEAVASIPFPGTAHAFVYTPDSFSIPRRRGTDGAGAHVWLREVIDNRATQIRFAREKHSIPSFENMSDSELEALDNERLTATYQEFAACQLPESDCRLLLAVSGLGLPPAADPCFDEAGKLASRAIGIWSQEDLDAIETDEPRECEAPLPEDPDDAADAFIELLLRVSREQFAPDCR